MERVKLTEQEKIANSMTNNSYNHFNMAEQDIDNILEKEKQNKFNNEVDAYVEKLDKHQEFLKLYAESFKESAGTIEIKPMFGRVLIKPFSNNPFQRIKIENGLITDLGGMTPEHFNTTTGEMEDDAQDIVTGVVIDAGNECKYLREGDVVFYRIGASIPVPFFKQGLYCVSEQQVIACVNENLTERFSHE